MCSSASARATLVLLGLSIVKHLTELHGGNVRVASAGVGRGATFSVCLPLQSVQDQSAIAHDAQRNAAVDNATARADLNGIKVLVIDDEHDSVTIVRRILERCGAEVRGANSMNDALGEFAQFCPDVVLSDIGMPGNDGYELISRLRLMPGGRAVPAVALTALARTETRRFSDARGKTSRLHRTGGGRAEPRVTAVRRGFSASRRIVKPPARPLDLFSIIPKGSATRFTPFRGRDKSKTKLPPH
ncbi:MAG: hypothetical protein DMF04_06735 [Verrucomicrobia bacterium]|nr:MAG: hypothetical protein DMF04_06735 [Verrucomicrobiota bacterium]